MRRGWLLICWWQFLFLNIFRGIALWHLWEHIVFTNVQIADAWFNISSPYDNWWRAVLLSQKQCSHIVVYTRPPVPHPTHRHTALQCQTSRNRESWVKVGNKILIWDVLNPEVPPLTGSPLTQWWMALRWFARCGCLCECNCVSVARYSSLLLSRCLQIIKPSFKYRPCYVFIYLSDDTRANKKEGWKVKAH